MFFTYIFLLYLQTKQEKITSARGVKERNLRTVDEVRRWQVVRIVAEEVPQECTYTQCAIFNENGIPTIFLGKRKNNHSNQHNVKCFFLHMKIQSTIIQALMVSFVIVCEDKNMSRSEYWSLFFHSEHNNISNNNASL